MDSLHRSGTGPAWLSTGATVRPPEPPLAAKSCFGIVYKMLTGWVMPVEGPDDPINSRTTDNPVRHLGQASSARPAEPGAQGPDNHGEPVMPTKAIKVDSQRGEDTSRAEAKNHYSDP
jgi:hypothetical protein